MHNRNDIAEVNLDRSPADLAAENARLRAELAKLRAAVASEPEGELKAILRRHARLALFGMKRTPAARVIAATWSSWRPGDPDPHGTFERLHRLAYRPVGYRSVLDLLDPALD